MMRSCVVLLQSPAIAADWSHLQSDVQPDIWLKPSSSSLRKPSVFFRRDIGVAPTFPGCFRARDVGTAAPLFKVTSPSCDYYALRLPLLKAGFKRIANIHSCLSCNLQWGKSIPFCATSALHEEHLSFLRPIHRFQRTNHFLGSCTAIGCKSGLALSLQAFRANHGDALGFISPNTWCLPSQMKAFLGEAHSCRSVGKHYIVKPARGSCGRGIRILSTRELDCLDEVMQQWRPGSAHIPYIAQEYVSNPMLIFGRKFDFRLYAAVTSFDPLVIYLHDKGLVRFAAKRYEPESVSDVFAHLTNYSIGRRMEKPLLDAQIEMSNLKWPMSQMMNVLKDEKGVDIAALRQRIDELVVGSLISVQKNIRKAESRQSFLLQNSGFELFGIDVLLDDEHRPWLIEYNTLPSLESSSTLDYNVKSDVITDLLNLLQLELFHRDEEMFASSGYLTPDWRDANSREICNSIQDCFDVSSREEELFCRLDDEVQFAGGFRRIFPTIQTLKRFQHTVESPTERMGHFWRRVCGYQ